MNTARSLLAFAFCVGSVLAAMLGGCATEVSPPDDTSPCREGCGSIVGTVVDATNIATPVGQSYVYVPVGVSSMGGSPAYARQDHPISTYTADADGSFVLEDVFEGPQTLVVEPPADSGYASLEITLTVPADSTVEIRITLVPNELAGSINSVVVDPPSPTIAPQRTQQFAATVLDSGGSALDLTPIWVTTGGLGTITEDGLFQAGDDKGTARVIAIVGEYSGQALVSIADSPPPAVELDVAPSDGPSPLTVSAVARASDIDGEVTAVEIEWGDGTSNWTGTGFPSVVQHTYHRAGSYAPVARATDDNGEVGSASAAVQVQNRPPTCQLEATPTSGDVPLDVSFSVSGSDPDGSMSEWKVDYGDGSVWGPEPDPPASLAHTYSAPGSYEARLTATDNSGGAAYSTVTIKAIDPSNALPEASLEVSPVSGPAPLSVTMTGSGTDSDGSIVRYELDPEGDGVWDYDSPDPPTSREHQYAAAGTYVPRLRVTDDKGAVATDSVQVDVSAGPELSVTPTVLQLGADETTGSFTVFNNGGGDLTWSVSESEDWIVGLDPATGTNSGSVTVTVDRSGLGGGDYAGTVSVSSNGGSATVQVQLGGAGTYPKHWNIDSRVFDVEIAPDGTVWVSDWDADGVRVFDSGGTEQRFIGGSGSADGQFDGLTRIAFDANDQAYVGDHYNYRVQVFDLAGQFLRKWGSQGTASGAQFETVWSVAIPSGGDVYVLEDANHRIQRFQSDGTYVSAFGDTDYNQPKGMAIDSSGNFYVADKGNHRIRKLGPDGTSISEWGSKGSGDGQLDEPYDVAVDSSDRIYVADLRNNRIQVFDSTGDFLWSSEADYPGLLNLPAGVEVSSAGEVFVAEYGGRRVTVLGPLD